jgi:hypothetical protein
MLTLLNTLCVSPSSGAHTRTSLASESGWARVPMSQTRPCVECHEPDCGRLYIYRLLISPSGISELDWATTKTDPAERSISIDRESLQVFFLTRRRGVLAGFTTRGGSRDETWRGQGIRKRSVSWNLPKI